MTDLVVRELERRVLSGDASALPLLRLAWWRLGDPRPELEEEITNGSVWLEKRGYIDKGRRRVMVETLRYTLAGHSLDTARVRLLNENDVRETKRRYLESLGASPVRATEVQVQRLFLLSHKTLREKFTLVERVS